MAYLDQARDFFEAAGNPRIRSTPLLYYYAFLNLSKFALVVRETPLPLKLQHGIADPRVNSKKQIRFSGQRVQWPGKASDRSELFPELLNMSTSRPLPAGSCSIRSLLRQIPTIHRTYCVVSNEQNRFLPLHDISLRHANGDLWARLSVRRSDAEPEGLLERIARRRAFKRLLTRVRSDKDAEIWLETPAVKAVRRGMDNGIRALARILEPLGITTILTRQGYRLYLSDIPPSQQLPQVAVAYAVMFYLGSITRYRPHDFERIVQGGESWIAGEFFSNQPSQVVHMLCSFLAGRAVHLPYAV